MVDKYEVIVVGAGLAGSSVAYKLANAGVEVVLVERGTYPGSKNLSGGVFYGRILDSLIPNYWEEAPIERKITRQTVTFMTEDASFNADFQTRRFSEPPFNGFSVLRAKFDRWLAEKAEAAGAMLVPGVRVDGLIREDGRVVGMRTGDEEMMADVIIAADGANSFLAQEAGLYTLQSPQVGVGIKELIELPRSVLEDRFNLCDDEGAAYGIVGFCTQGISGGAFLYTNLESVSIGIVVHLDDLMRKGLKPYDVLEDFLAHPMIALLIKGGKVLEYGAHLVPEAGISKMPKLACDGMLVVGDAAGLSVNNGLVVRGMDLAIGSGIAAADAVLDAKAKGDLALAGAGYQKAMDQSFVMADMRTYAQAPHFMENARLYGAYPQMVTQLMASLYTQDAQPKEHILPALMRSVKEANIPLTALAMDGLRGVRNL